MTDENFFEQIQEQQQKQEDRLSALQKILDAPLKQQHPEKKKKFSFLKKIKKMSDFFGYLPPEKRTENKN